MTISLTNELQEIIERSKKYISYAETIAKKFQRSISDHSTNFEKSTKSSINELNRFNVKKRKSRISNRTKSN